MGDTAKIVIIGDPGVGKTNILTRYVEDKFSTSSASISTDFLTKSVTQNGTTIKLQIYDTAGQERFRTITTSLYHGAAAVIIVFDVTNKETFERVEKWYQELPWVKKGQMNATVPILLVGNKIDLKRVIETNTAREWAERQKVKYLETSAKDNVGITELFEKILVPDLIAKSTPHPTNTELPKAIKKKGGCIII